MGKGKGLAIAGLAIVVFIVVAYVIVPSVRLPNSINLQWSVYGLKDGQRVTPPLAFIAQGVEIDALGGDCSWAAQGESVDWDTLIIDGEFTVFLEDYSGRQTDITPTDLSFVRAGVSAKEGTSGFSWALDDLLIGRSFTSADRTGSYWSVRIVLRVGGKVQQSVGVEYVQDSIDDYILYKIYWQDGTFDLTGGIVK